MVNLLREFLFELTFFAVTKFPLCNNLVSSPAFCTADLFSPAILTVIAGVRII